MFEILFLLTCNVAAPLKIMLKFCMIFTFSHIWFGSWRFIYKIDLERRNSKDDSFPLETGSCRTKPVDPLLKVTKITL